MRSGSSPTLCGLSERVSVSGLYCNRIVPSGMPLVGIERHDRALADERRDASMAPAPGWAPNRSRHGSARVTSPAASSGDAPARRGAGEQATKLLRRRGRPVATGPELGQRSLQRRQEPGAVRGRKAVQRDPPDVEVDRCRGSREPSRLRRCQRLVKLARTRCAPLPGCAWPPPVASRRRRGTPRPVAMLRITPPDTLSCASTLVVELRGGCVRREDALPDVGSRGLVGEGELHDEADPPHERRVESVLHVGGEDRNPAVGLHLLEQVADLEVGVAIVAVAHLAALAEQGVGLVEEQDRAALRRPRRRSPAGSSRSPRSTC